MASRLLYGLSMVAVVRLVIGGVAGVIILPGFSRYPERFQVYLALIFFCYLGARLVWDVVRQLRDLREKRARGFEVP